MRFCSENRRDEVLGILLVLLGITLRLLPHPANFTPVTAVALFSGVVLAPGVALLVPLLVMIASDLVIGPHALYPLTWGCFFLVSLIGYLIRKNPGIGKIFFGTLSGSLLFFVVTNLGVFIFQNMYAKNFSGLVECFALALPFFRNSLAGDLFYTTVFFTVFALLKGSLKALAAGYSR